MIIYKLCISVIFAADIKITYNNFKSSLVASADCKTIFTTNPGVIQSADEHSRIFIKYENFFSVC